MLTDITDMTIPSTTIEKRITKSTNLLSDILDSSTTSVGTVSSYTTGGISTVITGGGNTNSESTVITSGDNTNSESTGTTIVTGKGNSATVITTTAIPEGGNTNTTGILVDTVEFGNRESTGTKIKTGTGNYKGGESTDMESMNNLVKITLLTSALTFVLTMFMVINFCLTG
jgi:hypothetical protein